ncbi:beta-1,4-galactosyltransferase galt-1 isoform X2 [Folsomia candida]|uniref:beta-1,4-galactosyltransferase galt-1 isoform X2 n=1 Tax=Folsomia candida TaxID=158441 RepID=UPI0016050647|nr:beta-1,4-galactosyltransferase galt-1 isoform X2 [Folsomia candida]
MWTTGNWCLVVGVVTSISYIQHTSIKTGHVETGKTYIDTEYSAAFIICSLYLTISSLPEPKYVTLSPGESSQQEDDQEPPTLRIYQNLNRIKHQFGVCVQPIFSYDDTPRFVQWMEYNILMGATHFTFYNISIGPSVSCVLEEYKNSDNGIQVEVLPWSSPIQDDDLLHNNDQYGQASECVFRSRGKIEHLLMIDLDEYIVPSFPDRVQNYGELYIEISAQAKLGLPEGKDAVQFGFANGIFDLDCDNGTEKGEKNENEGIMSVQDLIIYRRITRPKAVDYGQMKFITTPNLVIEPGIHNLANSVDEKYVEFQVKPDLAYLHHYKGNGANNDKCQNPDGVDQSGQFYADKLLPLVNSRMQYVQKYCKFKNN